MPLGGYQLLREAGLQSPLLASYWFAGPSSLRAWTMHWVNIIFASAQPAVKPARRQAPAKPGRAVKKPAAVEKTPPRAEPKRLPRCRNSPNLRPISLCASS